MRGGSLLPWGDGLWKARLGWQIVNGSITYAMNGKQYVAVISGHSLVAFSVRD